MSHSGQTAFDVQVHGLIGPEGNSGNGQAISTGATSVQSTAITKTVVDLTATEDCFVAIGASPVAAANTDYFIPKLQTYRFAITSGNKVAVIQSSTGGILYVHPVGTL